MALMATNGRRFSPWWLLAMAVLAIVLFGVGGGLVSVFDSCIVNILINGGICSTGPYYAGLAFLSFGSLCSLGWFILLIVFIVSKPRQAQYNQTSVPMNGQNFATAQNGQQPQAQQHNGAQNQYYQPAVPNKEAYTTVQPLQHNTASPPYPVPNKEPYTSVQPVQHNVATPPYPVPNKESYTSVQPIQHSVPTPPYPVQELESPSTQTQQYNERRCGRCEAIVHSPFCPRCGSAVDMV